MARVNFPEISLDKLVPPKRPAHCVIRFYGYHSLTCRSFNIFYNHSRVRFVIAVCVCEGPVIAFATINPLYLVWRQGRVKSITWMRSRVIIESLCNKIMHSTRRTGYKGKPRLRSSLRPIQGQQSKRFLNEDFDLNGSTNGVHNTLISYTWN